MEIRTTEFLTKKFKTPDIILYRYNPDNWNYTFVKYFDPVYDSNRREVKEWYITLGELTIEKTELWNYSIRQKFNWITNTITYNLKTEKEAELYKKWLESVLWIADMDWMYSFEDRKEKLKEEEIAEYIDFDDGKTEFKWLDFKAPNINLYRYESEIWFILISYFNTKKYNDYLLEWKITVGKLSIEETSSWYSIIQKTKWEDKIVIELNSLEEAKLYKEWLENIMWFTDMLDLYSFKERKEFIQKEELTDLIDFNEEDTKTLKATKLIWLDFKAPNIALFKRDDYKWYIFLKSFFVNNFDYDLLDYWIITVGNLSIENTWQWYSIKQEFNWKTKIVIQNLKSKKEAELYKKWLKNFMWKIDMGFLYLFEERKEFYQKKKSKKFEEINKENKEPTKKIKRFINKFLKFIKMK